MATAKELSTLIRIDIDDLQEAKFSEYEMLVLINSVLRIINDKLCDTDSDLVEKETNLTMTDGYASLPSDFNSVIEVLSSDGSPLDFYPRSFKLDDGGYRISSGNLYTTGDVTLVYKSTITTITDLNSVLPLPDMFLEALRKLAVMMINKATTDAIDLEIVKSIISKAQSLHCRT